ncbi:hypothetical protein B7494_g2297 [Chlorociboria aeruginascens]|nr:hypothetical protein B7494_g2297 [Chlorociboria aeruginascens]
MVKNSKRNINEVDYESDGGFVSHDDVKAPKSKKSKKEKSASKGDEADNKFWELSSGRNPRRVEVSEFKNAKLINIREFYEQNGAMLPSRKGISLTVDQYKAFVNAIPEINAKLTRLGVTLEPSAEVDDESEAEVKPRKKVKAKKERSNIEETSDDEEN